MNDQEIVEGQIVPEQATGEVPDNRRPLVHVTENDLAVMPVISLVDSKHRYDAMVAFVKSIMHEGVDYGRIPGTAKPTLLKPGAEKLTTFFGLTKQFQVVNEIEDWGPERPLFYYRYRCSLSRNGLLIAEGDGSANSFEDRYRWRWMPESKVPAELDASLLEQRETKLTEYHFAYEKRETAGQYGKPESYWQQFDAAIADGTAQWISKKDGKGTEREAIEIGGTEYRIPNPDPFTLVNTIQKMAQKRAFIAATLLAVNASEFFTQDIEDMDGALQKSGDPFVKAKPTAAQAKPREQQPKPSPKVVKPTGADTKSSTSRSRAENQWESNILATVIELGLAENNYQAVKVLQYSPFTEVGLGELDIVQVVAWFICWLTVKEAHPKMKGAERAGLAHEAWALSKNRTGWIARAREKLGIANEQ